MLGIESVFTLILNLLMAQRIDFPGNKFFLNFDLCASIVFITRVAKGI